MSFFLERSFVRLSQTKVVISSDNGKFWSAIVRLPTVICSPGSVWGVLTSILVQTLLRSVCTDEDQYFPIADSNVPMRINHINVHN